jgi:type II pantothenate kinase
MSPPPADLDPTTGETGSKTAQPADLSSSPAAGRPRRTTVQSDIQEAILHPGNVRINVQGAFIVDEEQPGTPQSEDYEHDPKDIRLPNHTAVVSHIAIDVSILMLSCARLVAARDQLQLLSTLPSK